MIKVAILGHFGFNRNLLNGQTIKTKNLTSALAKKIGDEQILTMDTHGGVVALLKLPFQILRCLKKSENLIIMPASRGIQIITPLLLLLNRRKKRKIHYVVIGGWLPSLCLKKPKLAERIKKFDYVYVETKTLRKSLEELGFSNIIVMPNFKDICPLDIAELKSHHSEPLRICTFSRVMREKGIEDVVNVVKKINHESQRIVYCLDIYGQIDPSQTKWFNSLNSDFPPFIEYKGSVPFDKTVEVIKDYFALVFPTKFYTEGLPGTILDAYSAGVPVIASKWESFDDLIEEGKTGFGYEFNNREELATILLDLSKKPEKINRLKRNCLEKALCYLPDEIVTIMNLTD